MGGMGVFGIANNRRGLNLWDRVGKGQNRCCICQFFSWFTRDVLPRLNGDVNDVSR
jgi:hypothetical protein